MVMLLWHVISLHEDMLTRIIKSLTYLKYVKSENMNHDYIARGWNTVHYLISVIILQVIVLKWNIDIDL